MVDLRVSALKPYFFLTFSALASVLLASAPPPPLLHTCSFLPTPCFQKPWTSERENMQDLGE